MESIYGTSYLTVCHGYVFTWECVVFFQAQTLTWRVIFWRKVVLKSRVGPTLRTPLLKPLPAWSSEPPHVECDISPRTCQVVSATVDHETWWHVIREIYVFVLANVWSCFSNFLVVFTYFKGWQGCVFLRVENLFSAKFPDMMPELHTSCDACIVQLFGFVVAFL